MSKCKLTLAGFIYALYVGDTFIEYFDTHEEALLFAKQYYPQLNILIKPIAYFKYNQKEGRT